MCDGGSITSYHKPFPTAGVEAFLLLNGMSISLDQQQQLTLGKAFFVPAGSVKIGSYTYDEPADDHDPRLLPCGDLPSIVYSEILGDLYKIAGRSICPVT